MGGTIEIGKGEAKSFRRQVPASDGTIFTSLTTPFLNSDTLSFQVWPGGTLANLITKSASWIDYTTGTYQANIAASDTSSVDPGKYYFRTLVTRSTTTSRIDQGFFTVLPAPSSGSLPICFTTTADLIEFAPWLADIQTRTDNVGHYQQQDRATRRLVDTLVQSWKPGMILSGMDPKLFGGSLTLYSNSPSNWLRQQIQPLTPGSTPDPTLFKYRGNTTANLILPRVSSALLVYPEVVEICSRWAIAEVCMSQLGSGNTDRDWRSLAVIFEAQASSLYKARRFEIDLANPQTGFCAFAIDGGSTSLR